MQRVRWDIANPYELHSTLCLRLFQTERKSPEGEFLWRLEPETDSNWPPSCFSAKPIAPRLVADRNSRLVAQVPDAAIDLAVKLKLDSLRAGQKFRFRLRAIPACADKASAWDCFDWRNRKSGLTAKGESSMVSRFHGSLPPDYKQLHKLTH